MCRGKTSNLHKNSPGAERVRSHHQRMITTNLCLARSRDLSQVSEKIDKQQILRGGKMLFIMPMSSIHMRLRHKTSLPMGLRCKISHPPPLGRHWDTYTEVWRCSSLLIRHNWLNYTGVRNSRHVLEGITNYQRPLEQPQLISVALQQRIKHDP